MSTLADHMEQHGHVPRHGQTHYIIKWNGCSYHLFLKYYQMEPDRCLWDLYILSHDVVRMFEGKLTRKVCGYVLCKKASGCSKSIFPSVNIRIKRITRHPWCYDVFGFKETSPSVPCGWSNWRSGSLLYKSENVRSPYYKPFWVCFIPRMSSQVQVPISNTKG